VYITNIVLDQICRDILYLKTEGTEIGSVVVNLTRGYLIQPNVIQNIVAILEKHNISPRNFTFEMIEETLMFDLDRSTELLNELKRLGFGLGIDHFGKGLSSIAYLPRFEIDYMKIDDGLIKEILESDVNRTIVDTIIHLAHRLGLTIIADGIENRRQFKLIRELNCDAAQGVYFSKAIKREELREYHELMNVIV
jgi:EAL domain-containing protein (putative c-di-GMP-specific phosphodiesterase class I)